MSVVDDLAAVVGPTHVLDAPDQTAGYVTDHTGRFAGVPLAVVRPADVEQTTTVVMVCRAAGVAVVPQGGNTGLVGSLVPRGGEVVVSLRRLDRVGSVDPATAQLDAGAGVTLAAIQVAAAGAGLRFPLDFGARDSATVGGMVATNAGGVHALRHGMMRRRVVGLEWVGADGAVMRRMLGLVKDNTGYDLSGLMCGSEGTLGVVTAARLQLEPAPAHVVTAMVETDSIRAALEAAAACRGLGSVEAIEFMGPECLEHGAPATVLVECASERDPLDDVAAVLEGRPGIRSTSVATDAPRRHELWAVRDGIPESILRSGVPIKIDVAVAVPKLGAFLDGVGPAVASLAPAARVWRFGHAGDGNIHVNVTGCDPHGPVADAIEEAVLRLAVEHGGTISAEHGVGLAKARWLTLSRSPAELASMTAIKFALDPTGMFNPGVLGL